MDYALIGKHLREKRDVSDLKLYPLLWGRVLWKNYFFASCRTDPSATVPPLRGALSRRLQSQSVFVLGSVFVRGLCSTNLSREPTRHRRLSEGALRSTLPPRLPQPCVSQYAGRCQRSARLAHLRGSGGAPDQKGKTALFRRANRCRTTTKRLCTCPATIIIPFLASVTFPDLLGQIGLGFLCLSGVVFCFRRCRLLAAGGWRPKAGTGVARRVSSGLNCRRQLPLCCVVLYGSLPGDSRRQIPG